MNAKILQAIAECNKFIALEQPRPADTRPAHVAQILAHYIAHRAKLINMLT